MSLRFTIEVHIDDVEVLYKIAQTLGIGKVLKNKHGSSALFFVTKFEDITRASEASSEVPSEGAS